MSFCHLCLKLFLKVHFSKVYIYFQLVISNVTSYWYFSKSITLCEKIRCHHMIDCIWLIMTILVDCRICFVSYSFGLNQVNILNLPLFHNSIFFIIAPHGIGILVMESPNIV